MDLIITSKQSGEVREKKQRIYMLLIKEYDRINRGNAMEGTENMMLVANN